MQRTHIINLDGLGRSKSLSETPKSRGCCPNPSCQGRQKGTTALLQNSPKRGCMPQPSPLVLLAGNVLVVLGIAFPSVVLTLAAFFGGLCALNNCSEQVLCALVGSWHANTHVPTVLYLPCPHPTPSGMRAHTGRPSPNHVGVHRNNHPTWWCEDCFPHWDTGRFSLLWVPRVCACGLLLVASSQPLCL